MRTNDRALQGRTDVEEQRTEILIARDVTVRLREDIAAVRSDTAAHVHATERAVEATAATNERCDADRTAANDLLNTFAEQLESLGDVGSGGAHTMSPARTFLSGRGHMDIIRERRVRRARARCPSHAAPRNTHRSAPGGPDAFKDLSEPPCGGSVYGDASGSHAEAAEI